MTKILVIDDERGLLEELIDVLTFEGFDVIGADNGSEGVKMAMYHQPDLILCDVMMPVMDGYSVIQELRNYQDTCRIPFVFLTAKAGIKDLRYGMNLGADDYITKPFDSRELLESIRTRLDKHSQMEADYKGKLEAMRQMLVTTLPHELRTPLTGIIGAAQAMNYCADDLTVDEISGYSDIILNSGNRLYRLIENYILISQLYTVEGGYSQETLNKMRGISFPATLIKDLVTQVTSQSNRYHDVSFDIGDNVNLKIAPEHLRKIAAEIIDNALKFSDADSKLCVSTRHNKEHFMMSVLDSGRGMTASQIKQIAPFVQFDRDRYEQQGAGLGLAIVKKLVELYKGKLTIDSQPNRGTRVMIELPLDSKQGS